MIGVTAGPERPGRFEACYSWVHPVSDNVYYVNIYRGSGRLTTLKRKPRVVEPYEDAATHERPN